MADTEYTVQEASALLGIPIQKLRRWDKQGVLVALRTGGGHRRYPRDLIDRIAANTAASLSEKLESELNATKRSLAEKRRIIQLLVESEGRYRDLVETSHDLIWATDAQGSFVYLNNAANEIFGLAPDDLLGRCFFDFEAETSHISNRRFLALLKRNGEIRNHITHLRTVNGEDRWIGINARVTSSERGEMRGIRGTARDITEQQDALRKIEYLAMHDTLTELPNRHSLQRRIENAMQDGAIGALMFVDIDHFKYLNDNFGYRAGDQIIVGVGSALRSAIRPAGGELYRLGGDEFAVHLPEVLRKEAISSAQQALDAVRHYRYQGEDNKAVANLSASIGIALYPFHGENPRALLSNTDIAMYQAKDLGRNRYALFDQDSDSLRSTHKRINLAKKLRDSLDEDRLTLFAQPVVRLNDRKVMHHEILLRVRGDDGEYALPAQFIETAETLGLVQEIDICVVRKLLEYIDAHGLAGGKSRYFVNLSRVSISNAGWVENFLGLMRGSGIDPTQFVFEITETAALSEIDVTLSFIKRLKDMGCRFALDDFGAGFSSFYYLKRFEVDYLKIDGSFVRDIVTDESSRLFVKALNDVARGMKKQVIAEWVEETAALDMLVEMGTEYGQGYLFQRPQLLEGRHDEARVLQASAA